MRGRKPVPTALHKLRGTFDSSRHGKRRSGEPVATGDIGAAPGWMDEGQRDAWQFAVKNAPAGILSRIDASVLTAWVIACEEHRRATVALRNWDACGGQEMLIAKKDGYAPSPYLTIVNKAALRMMKAASELGFTPASRPRLGVAKDQEAAPESPWAKFTVVDGGRKA